jgi:hypothetical protein
MCRYLKTWFVLDLISAIPFAWFIDDLQILPQDGEDNDFTQQHETVIHHTS